MKREIITIGQKGKVHIPTATPVLDVGLRNSLLVRCILR